MARLALTILAILAALIASGVQFFLRPRLSMLGVGRIVVPRGNDNCKAYPELKACEKLVIHQPTGLVYLACSTQESRTHWIPTTNRLNATGKSYHDYVAHFDPDTGKITKLATPDFKFSRGLGLHGMDVVPAKSNPKELFVYLVNHREPLAPGRAEDVGADSVIEVFKTPVRGTEMNYLYTFKDDVIATPNDVVGLPDGQSFFFTNDHGNIKTGLARKLNLDVFFLRPWSNVGFCHAKDGCKVVAPNIQSANGITRNKDGLIFVASCTTGQIFVFKRQRDNSLVLADVIKLDRPVDNLSVDSKNAVWAAGMPMAMHMAMVHFANPSIENPSSALKITTNEGQSQYFGEKYKVETVFEDDGRIASGTTSVAYDAQRRRLFLHGIAAPHLTVCEV